MQRPGGQAASAGLTRACDAAEGSRVDHRGSRNRVCQGLESQVRRAAFDPKDNRKPLKNLKQEKGWVAKWAVTPAEVWVVGLRWALKLQEGVSRRCCVLPPSCPGGRKATFCLHCSPCYSVQRSLAPHVCSVNVWCVANK